MASPRAVPPAARPMARHLRRVRGLAAHLRSSSAAHSTLAGSQQSSHPRRKIFACGAGPSADSPWLRDQIISATGKPAPNVVFMGTPSCERPIPPIHSAACTSHRWPWTQEERRRREKRRVDEREPTRLVAGSPADVLTREPTAGAQTTFGRAGRASSRSGFRSAG